MNIRAALIALLSLTLFTLQPAYARHQAGQQTNHQKMDWKKELGLSDQQLKKIKEIKDVSHDDMKEMRVKKWWLYKEMVMMSHQKKLDQEKLNSLLSDMNSISEKLMRQEIQMKHAIYITLTPKQQTKMNTMMQKRLKEMEKIYAR